jgi:hypothetical protein
MEGYQSDSPTNYVVPGGGTFFSIPPAFTGIDPNLAQAIKFQFFAYPGEVEDDELNITTSVAIDRVLIDLAALRSTELSHDKIIRDCEVVIESVRNKRGAIDRIVDWFQEDEPKIEELIAHVEEAGLSEHQAVKAGGGLIFLVILAAAVLVGGCAHTRPYVKKDPGPVQGAPGK